MKTLSTLLFIPAAILAIAATSAAQGGQSCCGGMMSMQRDAQHPAKAVQAKQFEHKQTATADCYSTEPKQHTGCH